MEKEEVCAKCGYKGECVKKFNFFLCNVCNCFAPDNESDFNEYIQEKLNGDVLETFRKNFQFKGKNQKKGMLKKAIKGSPMSRAPFGYKIQNKKLFPAENFREVEEIFQEFLDNSQNLTKLSKKHNLSINGLKKILTNFTYLGKIKFNGQIHQGTHEPILSSTLFNHVQNKLERLRRK